jgi:hypothetical protein
MNRLSERELQLHVTILGWLYIVGNAFFLLVALVSFGLLPSLGVVSRDPDAMIFFGVLGTAVGVVMVALGLPGLVAGYGLLRRKSWARFLALVLGILNLVNIPVGTAIGVYTMLVLLQESADQYFAPHQPA